MELFTQPEIGVENINRAHLREFIHYEESEAIGIDTPGSDLLAYQWKLEPIKSSLTIGLLGVWMLATNDNLRVDRATRKAAVPMTFEGSKAWGLVTYQAIYRGALAW